MFIEYFDIFLKSIDVKNIQNNSCRPNFFSKRKLAYINLLYLLTFTKKRIDLFLRTQLQFTASPKSLTILPYIRYITISHVNSRRRSST